MRNEFFKARKLRAQDALSFLVLEFSFHRFFANADNKKINSPNAIYQNKLDFQAKSF